MRLKEQGLLLITLEDLKNNIKENKIMEKTFKIVAPTMPDYVQLERPGGRRQDGISFDKGFPIRDFTREEAEEFGELLKTTFIEHWKQQQS